MAIEYLVIAGPQAAGKSTVIKTICSVDAGMSPLGESRQIIVHKYQRRGAIFMTDLDEIEVIHLDMTRMFTTIAQHPTERLYIDETNVFTLGHARAHGIDLLDGYFKQYCDMLARLKAGIVFLSVPPNTSWERRRHRYIERLWDLNAQQRHVILARYKSYLERLQPELLAIYDRLELPKIKIDGTGALEETLRAVTGGLRQLQGTP